MGVGKTTFLFKVSNDSTTPDPNSTIGIDFVRFTQKNRLMHDRSTPIKAQFWDNANDYRFKSVRHGLYRRFHGFFIIFDLTSSISFNNVRSWMEEIIEFAPEHTSRVLVGNKSDLFEAREIYESEIRNIADEYNMPYFEVSAKNGSMIEDCVQKMIEMVSGEFPNLDQELMTSIVRPVHLSLDSLEQANKSCC